MHPFGCFGSSLAFDDKSSACQGCAERQACSKIVEDRRPRLLRLLMRFTDSKGEQMAFHWLTAKERKTVKAGRKAKSLDQSRTDTYGDLETALSVRGQLDKRSVTVFDKMTMARINVQDHNFEIVGAFSKALSTIISLLKHRSHTMKELSEALVDSCSYSASTARREAFALTSILTVCDRVNRSGSKVELK